MLRGLFASWAAHLPENTVVFDTNRLWTARLPALLAIMPDAKIICTVRSVAAIMDSIERLIRGNPLLPSRLFSDDERANVYTRTDALSQRNRLVGSAWTCLKEAFYGPNADWLLVVDYDYLAQAPAKVTALIYEFLGEKPFAHDFDNLVFDEPDFDEELRMPGAAQGAVAGELRAAQIGFAARPLRALQGAELLDRGDAERGQSDRVAARSRSQGPHAQVIGRA